MKSSGAPLSHFIAAFAVMTGLCVGAVAANDARPIGSTTALIAEASTADDPSERIDGRSGDIAFPYLSAMKVLASVGESDPTTGMVLTGYPDGHAAWLADEATVRISYQSESYATMGSETYGWRMKSGARFTGSHIHFIDYDRAGLASFLDRPESAQGLVRGSGHLFDRVFNVFGEEVVPAAQGGRWGNQSRADGSAVAFHKDYKLSEGDFFFQSFCGAVYQAADAYGSGIGFADPVWLTAEEWNIQKMFVDKQTGKAEIDAHETMGLASLVVEIRNRVAYTAPALGQTGYEKLLPLNPQHRDYVVLVLAGYNHGVEPAPLKIYVGRKGLDAQGRPVDQAGSATQRDKFLARNGLLYGRIYGLAVRNSDFPALGINAPRTDQKMLERYLTNPDAAEVFKATFFPTSYQWQGWEKPVAVGDTEMRLWQRADEQPAGHTFFVGDSKVEHPAADPDPRRTRYIQNMTHKGGMLAIDLEGIGDVLSAAKGRLPASLPVRVTRLLGAFDGALRVSTGGKGLKHGGAGDASTDKKGRAKATAPDGLAWIRTADADVLLVDEDSGNPFGERKYALVLDRNTLRLKRPGTGYFLAMAGGKKNPRAAAKVSAFGGTFSKSGTAEFSGSWNISALIARKADGSFHSARELAGPGEAEINARLPLARTMLIGVVQMKGESGGLLAKLKADRGGQLFAFRLSLPANALAQN